MSGRAIWHVPLLIAAGMTALAGVAVAVAVMRGALPPPWGPALPWGFAGASVTFTLARIIHARRVGARELELMLLALAILIADMYLVVAACAIGLSLLGLIGNEGRRRVAERAEEHDDDGEST